MSEYKWVDETSYQRGERGNIEPCVWTLKTDDLRLSVHRIYGLEGWFMSAFGIIRFSDQELTGIEDVEKAKFVALEELVSQLSSIFHKWHNIQRDLLKEPKASDKG